MANSSQQKGLSVVVTTYDPERYPDFKNCVKSLLVQSYSPLEIVLVIEDEMMYNKAQSDFDSDNITYVHSEIGGLAKARNRGVKEATHEVVAFIDDDCVAPAIWAEEIMKTQSKAGINATAGPCIPKWPNESRPAKVPLEMGWLVGVTNPEFDTEGFVRNAYGCNLSIQKDIFLELDGFDETLGKDHSKNLQGEDADLCARLEENYPTSVWFNSRAKVLHKVYPSQLDLSWLINRAYLQGYTKAVFKTKGNTLSTEENFLSYLLKDAIPQRVKNIVFRGNLSGVTPLFFVCLYSFLVGLGYIRGKF